VSTENTASDGTKSQVVYGSNPKGILILDASGRFAWIGERADRPKFKTSPGKARSEGTAEEFTAAARTFGANFGTWSLNEADKTLTYRTEGSLIPNNEGTELKESINLAGDELKLSWNLVAGGRGDEVYTRAR
jgi:hypothetical protein